MKRNIFLPVLLVFTMMLLCLGITSCVEKSLNGETSNSGVMDNSDKEDSDNPTQDYSNLQAELDNWITEHLELKDKVDTMSKEMVTLIIRVKTLESNVDRMTEEQPANTSETQLEEETTQTPNNLDEEFKNQVIEFIEQDLVGKVNKITYTVENNSFYLAYNSRWASEDTLKKEVFDIVTMLAENNSDVNIDITVTNDMGTSHHSYTKTDVMKKIKNLEISFDEWLEEAF